MYILLTSLTKFIRFINIYNLVLIIHILQFIVKVFSFKFSKLHYLCKLYIYIWNSKILVVYVYFLHSYVNSYVSFSCATFISPNLNKYSLKKFSQLQLDGEIVLCDCHFVFHKALDKKDKIKLFSPTSLKDKQKYDYYNQVEIHK